MSRTAERIDPMDVGEQDVVYFDFSARMASGEVISSVEVTAAVARGRPDEDAQQMVAGSPIVGSWAASVFAPASTGTVVSQRIDARMRLPQNTYTLRCLVTLSTGRQLVLAANLPVVRI